MTTKSVFHQQADFLDAGNVNYPTNDQKQTELAIELIEEEFKEWQEEAPFVLSNQINDLKECIDLIYVASQYLNQAVGPDAANQLFTAVHRNNMDKCIDGKLVKAPNGKILKPEGFDKMGWLPEFKAILKEL